MENRKKTITALLSNGEKLSKTIFPVQKYVIFEQENTAKKAIDLKAKDKGCTIVSWS